MAVVNGTIIRIYNLDLKSEILYEKDKVKTYNIPYIMTIGCKQLIFII